MDQLPIEAGNIWLLVLVLALGWLVAAVYYRRLLAQARKQARGVEAERAHIDRQLARSESTVYSLQERLEETRLNLTAKEADLQLLAQRYAQLDKEQAELRAVHTERLTSFQEMKANFEQSREQLKAEFQNLANQILEEKGKTFAQNSQSSLDALLKPFREQIDGFQQRVNQVHDETLRGNVSLGSEIKIGRASCRERVVRRCRSRWSAYH